MIGLVLKGDTWILLGLEEFETWTTWKCTFVWSHFRLKLVEKDLGPTDPKWLGTRLGLVPKNWRHDLDHCTITCNLSLTCFNGPQAWLGLVLEDMGPDLESSNCTVWLLRMDTEFWDPLSAPYLQWPTSQPVCIVTWNFSVLSVSSWGNEEVNGGATSAKRRTPQSFWGLSRRWSLILWRKSDSSIVHLVQIKVKS